MTDLASRRFRFRTALLLLAVAYVMVLPALQGSLLNYDDINLIEGEEGALARSPGSFFTGLYYFAYQPLYGLSLWMDGKLGATAESPLLFHLGNVLWHAAACYAAFCVLLILLENRTAALLGALLFAVHPLHVESVAWISGRKDVISGCLFFVAWLCHLRERGFWAVVFFLLACFAKASAVALPALLVAAAALLPRYEGRRREAVLATVPLFVVAIIPIAVHLGVGVVQGVVTEQAALGARLLGFVGGWGGSLLRTVVPWDLSIDYPEAAAAGVVPGALLLAAVVAFFLLRRRAPVAAFGLAAFFVALLPFNNVFPATTVLAADRYLYLPLFGVALIGGWLVTRYANAGLVLGVVVAAYLGLSLATSTRFESSEVLWTKTIEARPSSALAHLNRGIDRAERSLRATPRDKKLLQTAVVDLRGAMTRASLKEHKAKANRALILPLLVLGKKDEALERANNALDLVAGEDSANARRFRALAHFDRGMVFKDGHGRFREAARDFEASARIKSRYQPWFEAGQNYLAAAQLDRAARALGKASLLERDNPDPHLQLAVLHRAKGNRGERRRALEEASRRAPGTPRVVAAWVRYWLDAQSPDHARALKELDRMRGDSPAKRKLAADIEAQRALFLFRRGDLRDALTAADASRDGGLTDSRVLYDLGQIYLDAGRYDDAIRCYQRAADVFEQRSIYRDAIARAYALKAYRFLRIDDPQEAARSMRAALKAQPELIEAGAAPLRDEIHALRECKNDDVLGLAVAVVAGDPKLGEVIGARLLGAELDPKNRTLVYRLRADLRIFTPPVDYRGAEEDLRQVLARDAKDAWARYRLAQAWVRAGIGWKRTAVKVGSTERAREGEALLSKAIDLLGELILENPDFHYARLQRGEARFAKGDLLGAKADYLALRERGAEIRESPVKEAVLHRFFYVRGGDDTNHLVKALDLLTEALKRDPNYFDALYELGNVHHLLYDRQNDPSEDRKRAFHRAVFWYRRAMALNPRMEEPRLEWARLLLKAARAALAGGQIRPAHELLGRLESEAPDVVAVHKERVRVNMRPEFAEAVKVSPEQRFESAQKALAAIAAKAPNDPELKQLRSLFHRRRGYSFYLTWVKMKVAKDDERRETARKLAVEEWTRAVAAWPEDPDNESVRRGLRELAPELIGFDEKQAREAFEAGKKAFEQERWLDAIGHFRKALFLFPESMQIRLMYGMALARAGHFDRAGVELAKVANAGDDYPEALYTLGSIYDVRKEPLVARVWFERYLRVMEARGETDDPLVARTKKRLAELKADK